jgi:hypothetical protein
VSHIDVGSVTSEDINMGKLIWRGFSKSGNLISSQAAFITGANLRKQPQKPVEKQEKEPKKKPIETPT